MIKWTLSKEHYMCACNSHSLHKMHMMYFSLCLHSWDYMCAWLDTHLLSIFSHVLGGFSLEGWTIVCHVELTVCRIYFKPSTCWFHWLAHHQIEITFSEITCWCDWVKLKPTHRWLHANTGHDCSSQVVWLVQSRLLWKFACFLHGLTW